ncbi:hypothetical protein [Carboxylicivirga marina]|uniref:DUF7935 family protein n=1 Tax=Carboxylicivirga marina TaxID=2800988 RepID=UPI002597C07D|nr:hypothetical protein [uncultured Carboxylicivirga sp.]
MITINELLKIAAVVLLIALPLLILIRWFFKHNLKLKELELANSTYKELIPTRLQAYERLAILLERISPETIVIRENKQGLSSLQFQKQLLQIIRQEFEHNFAMQIYLPAKTWDAIIKARDEVVKLINTSAAETQANAPSMELSRIILEKGINDTNFYIKKAKEVLKKDIQLYYFD